jgi:hypothetical protein
MASTDPDTMYYQQAMKEPDREKFQAAMEKECSAHYREGNYKWGSHIIIHCMVNEKKKKIIHRRDQ